MQQWGSRKEKYNYYNYLTSIVKGLENKHTIIDLRNESCVSGLIKQVDGLMNVEMENVVFYDSWGREHRFKDFYISARNIRYVHIPEGLSAVELMKSQIDGLNKSKIRKPRKDNFKTIRAKRYHQEILQSLNESMPGPSTARD